MYPAAKGETWRAIALLLLALSGTASGLDRERSIGELFHTAWTVTDGAPGTIMNFAQTTDGYLWLDTAERGLIRFDGLHFEDYEPLHGQFPSRDVSALLATPDGGLWIGYRAEGFSFLKHGDVTNYGVRQGCLLPATVYRFALDSEGTLWAATSRGVERFRDSRWEKVDVPGHLPAYDVLADRDGKVWVLTIDSVSFAPVHGRKFQLLETGGPYSRLEADRNGTVWVIPQSYKVHIAPGQGKPLRSGTLPVGDLLADRDGSVWIMDYKSGLRRLPDVFQLTQERGEVQHFTEREGLSDNRVMALFEDREGNVWAGTRGGLDRFRQSNVVPGPFPRGGSRDLALAADAQASIWAAGGGRPVTRFQRGRLSVLVSPSHITCAYQDPGGVVWVGGAGVLLRIVNGRPERVPVPTDIAKGQWEVQAMTADRTGGLWISVVQHGVYRLENQVWTPFGDRSGLPKSMPISLWTDGEGRVWFGYRENQLAMLDQGKVTTFSISEGVRVGNITSIGGRGEHVWVGGQFGLARKEGNRFRMVATWKANKFGAVTGIVERSNGEVWLNQEIGLTRIPAAEIARNALDRNHPLGFELFDVLDGIPGNADILRPHPSIIEASDGRIWISGARGVAWIDPARIKRNPLPPPVQIQSITVNGKPFDPGIRLPASPSDMRFDYAALSLSIPERVRFRYRLEGYEKDWQDAGTRRSAFYTKLGPGQYTFHVIACNNDGVWNKQGASAALLVPPAFFQTTWFGALCIAAALGLIRLFYLLRLRQIAAAIQGKFNERLAERARIARDLHDSLLQNLVGVSLQLDGIAKQATYAPDAGQAAIRHVRDEVDACVREARGKVWDLRVPAGEGLPFLLGQVMEQFGSSSSARCGLTVVGTPRPCPGEIEEELLNVAKEAVHNAIQHARPKEIQLILEYRRRSLLLSVSDDGDGFNWEEGSRKPGHWGLKNMHERVEKIRGKWKITTAVGQGTRMEVKAPYSLKAAGEGS
jgi:signal transduction histidine kinase/ligand-binding sensor domain-containing protein